MEKGDEWEDSKCGEDTWLHRYNIIAQWPECVMEVCELCGDEQYFVILPDGSSDNMRYISTHLREALPMNHPYSAHEYHELFLNFIQ